MWHNKSLVVDTVILLLYQKQRSLTQYRITRMAHCVPTHALQPEIGKHNNVVYYFIIEIV